jgi:transposase-like protein
MKGNTRHLFSPEFRLESAQLVVDQKYSTRKAALAVEVAH